MFTGLVQKIGTLKSLDQKAKGVRITVSHDQWNIQLEQGESVSVDGACFTVTTRENNQFCCDALYETLRRTNLLSRNPGSKLNLERALRMGDKIGGHLVTGHVDGVAHVVSIHESNGDTVLHMECDDELLRGIILKGSIACNGVSLTVSRILESGFEVSIIPFTWANTNLSLLNPGDLVNAETDVLGKYVFRRNEQGNGAATQFELDDLKRAGFLSD